MFPNRNTPFSLFLWLDSKVQSKEKKKCQPNQGSQILDGAIEHLQTPLEKQLAVMQEDFMLKDYYDLCPLFCIYFFFYFQN